MRDLSAKHHRRSIRYPGYDYTQPGAYFVTIVTNGHKPIFGKIIDQEICYFDLGNIVKTCWSEIPIHFRDVDVDPHIIMPNHIHGIITIHEGGCRGTIYRAPTADNQSPPHSEFGKPVRGSLATIVRTFKASVSRIAKQELGLLNIWQRNYYEHIIRNEQELLKIYDYILTNPNQWLCDPEYSQTPYEDLP
jgi:putative transposase